MTIPATYPWASNASLIAAVARLGYLDGSVLDVTYGKGSFWKIFRPADFHAHDLRLDGVDFRNLPEADDSYDVVVLDGPYKLNGTPSAADVRYGVDEPATWQERHALIRAGMDEGARVARKRLIVKCQDQVCAGHVRWQTIEFTNHMVDKHGAVLVDRFDMTGKVRKQPLFGARRKGFIGPPRPRRQVHAQGRPSTLLVFDVSCSDGLPLDTDS